MDDLARLSFKREALLWSFLQIDSDFTWLFIIKSRTWVKPSILPRCGGSEERSSIIHTYRHIANEQILWRFRMKPIFYRAQSYTCLSDQIRLSDGSQGGMNILWRKWQFILFSVSSRGQVPIDRVFIIKRISSVSLWVLHQNGEC